MPRGREVLVKLRDIVIRRLLTRFDLVIAVSRAVVHDFPSILYLARRLKILDPGVGFTSDDIRLLEDIRRNATKGDYVIARGRLDKGVVEALIAYKLASSRLPYRLVIVDNEGLRLRLEKLAKLLSIGDRVVVMDSMTRTQFLKLLAGARALIYPSHMDAYPYTVAESLLLGTPVVAYRIPALEIYYGRSGIRGVYMVDEGDVGALSESLLEAVNTTIVEPPKVRMWSEIMNEELETLRSLL